jgi:hypothetical protein
MMSAQIFGRSAECISKQDGNSWRHLLHT